MNLSCRLNAVLDRHHKVHDYDVRTEAQGFGDGLLAVAGLSDDRDVAFCAEERSEADTHHFVVVGDEDFDLA